MLLLLPLLLLPFVVAIPVGTTPIPVVIWHGLGDRYDAVGLLALKHEIEQVPALKGVFVHLAYVEEEGSADSRATFYGSANEHVARVCQQIASLDEISSPILNPSRKFNAIGFSQGGQLLRAVVERCGGENGVSVKNLITVGSQHMGISELPPCPPDASPFSACRLAHLSVVKSGIYSSFAQEKIVPAQYFRDESKIEAYLSINTFLRDINNERPGDRQVGPPSAVQDEGDRIEPRNPEYKQNFMALENLVLYRFSRDQTVIPGASAHFTLPDPNAKNCPPTHNPIDPCYPTPLPLEDLPLYQEDYIGLRKLDERGKVFLDVCIGEHMQIDRECLAGIITWLGNGKGDKVEERGEKKLVWQS